MLYFQSEGAAGRVSPREGILLFDMFEMNILVFPRIVNWPEGEVASMIILRGRIV